MISSAWLSFSWFSQFDVMSQCHFDIKFFITENMRVSCPSMLTVMGNISVKISITFGKVTSKLYAISLNSSTKKTNKNQLVF